MSVFLPHSTTPTSAPHVETISGAIRAKKAAFLFICTLFTLGLNFVASNQRKLLKEVLSGKRITVLPQSSTITDVAHAKLSPPAANRPAATVRGPEEYPSPHPEEPPPTASLVEIPVSPPSIQTPRLISVEKGPTFPLLSKISSSTAPVNDQMCKELLKTFAHSTLNETQATLLDKKKAIDSFFTTYCTPRLEGTSLSECGCCSATQRGKNDPLDPRFEFEYRIMQKVESLMTAGKIDKTKPLFLCSLSPGNLLEELFLHACLSRLGIPITWLLCDTFYFNEKGIKKDFAPLSDFYSYIKALSEKQNVPLPNVYVAKGCEQLMLHPDMISGLQDTTTNPFVWFSIDEDDRVNFDRHERFLQGGHLNEDDLSVLLVGSLRGTPPTRKIFQSNLSDETGAIKESDTLGVLQRLQN